MDHKELDSFLISSQGVNWLLNESGNSYFNNKNPTDTILTSSHDSSHKPGQRFKIEVMSVIYYTSQYPFIPKTPGVPTIQQVFFSQK
jgi:hypothetical protein